MKKFRLTELLIWVVGTELVGAVSALIAGGNFGESFASLDKPPLSPPAWVFPIAWAVLYGLMGYSGYLIYLSDNAKRGRALKLFALQLIVNFIWVPVFFGKKSLIGGLVIIILLDILVVMMTAAFCKIRKKAALANLPYVVWCLFATYLTTGLYILNK
ncbi:TspO/MBR family protein [Ruminococcus sp.]|uniref:TspO/MBR family protein n=1 Tax=Ruminococcus sp. TaxID=41978 RepID=UPI0025F76D7B|nr:TspO/MBR family protein [Ruminococcus sp.]MBQ8965296.1 tryptophan-rich sensory protein [Ruminococcus sp.]